MVKLNHLALVVAAFLIGALASRGQSPALTEGAKPYTPSRLEWLALSMEAQSRVELSSDSFSIDFTALEKENAILIFVRYLPNAHRELMNLRIENNKELINTIAKNMGWSAWLKIREDVKMEQLPTK
jgi:hypothetical protein